MLFPVNVLTTIGSLWLEIRAERLEPHIAMADHTGVIIRSPNRFKTIPLYSRKQDSSFSGACTLVSEDDYERVMEYSDKWHLSSNGYVVSCRRQNQKYKATYLHKFIFGGSATHINDDRLDNRRSNLMETVGRSKRRVFDNICMEDFEIHTTIPQVFYAPDVPPDSTKPSSVIVHYEQGKSYSGKWKNKRPHGFGMLHEAHKLSAGNWDNGVLKNGMVIVFQVEAYRVDHCKFRIPKRCYFVFNEFTTIDVDDHQTSCLG
jgi:hypothetical protein